MEKDPACERLMTVPGIGPIISSAMVAAIGNGEVFSEGRDFAACLGLVPRQISTGDRTILGKISKRGNRYLRVLFVQAAWVVLIWPQSWERHGLRTVTWQTPTAARGGLRHVAGKSSLLRPPARFGNFTCRQSQHILGSRSWRQEPQAQ
jgi:transposase